MGYKGSDGATNFDGSRASVVDKGFAGAGALLPDVSGSAQKEAIEFIAERAVGAYREL